MKFNFIAMIIGMRVVERRNIARSVSWPGIMQPSLYFAVAGLVFRLSVIPLIELEIFTAATVVIAKASSANTIGYGSD